MTDQNQPVTAEPADGPDPSNADPDEFTAPLDPDDDVYSLLTAEANRDQQ